LALHLAVLQQAPSISFDFTVAEFVLLGRMPHKKWLERDSPDDRTQMRQILVDLELIDLAERTLPSLSGGERQRVYLAQALAQDTHVLFLDEPTSHLDVFYQFDLLKRLRRLVDDGKTVVAVFHDLELAARFSDQVLVLQEGALTASGPPDAALTSDLIRRVFRMEARLIQSENAPPHFHYLDTIRNEDLHTDR
jgi:iron complex transport system ATP-binding protein